MKKVVFNESHIVAVRDRIYQPKYDHKSETLTQYGQEIRTAALSLDYRIPDRQLVEQIIVGLPPTLRERAQLLSSTYDEIVERMARVERTALVKGERFFAFDETALPAPGEGGKPVLGHADYVVADGRSVVRKPGKKCFRKNCDQNGGLVNLSSDHAKPKASAGGGAGSSGAPAAGNGDGGGQN